MAELKTQCPHCGKRYLVEEKHLGQNVECEKCRRSFDIARYDPSRKRPRLSPIGVGTATGPLNLAGQKPLIGDRMEDGAEEITIPRLDVTLRRVEPGSFMCGRNDGYGDEQPVHKVSITRSFWIGTRPVTQAVYQRIMVRNPSYFLGENRPVETLTWDEAVEFCRCLTELLRARGLLKGTARFRLPTEAEWEYVCRTVPVAEEVAVDDVRETRRFAFGDDASELAEYAWFCKNSGGRTHDVATRAASPRGLYDLHGNVGEWCLDWLAPYTSEEQADPRGPATGERKVRRGGTWGSTASRCLGADRLGVAPNCRSALVGFRVLLAWS